MTRKERIIKAINHEETDIIPYDICFTRVSYDKVATYYGDKQFIDKIGNHLVSVVPVMEDTWVEIYFQDEFGVIWNRTRDKDIGIVENYVLENKNDLDKYVFPSPLEEGRFSKYESTINENPDLFVLAVLGFSLFERAWILRGMENLLVDMIRDPVFVEELLDRILEFNLSIIERSIQYKIDGFRFGDDWGQQHGLIMGPKLWRKFIKPRLVAMYKILKDNGRFVFIHSCGDITEILPDLIEIGLDVFNPFQPEVMNVYEIKKKYGEKLCFFGGISTQRLLPYGTPEEIINTIKNLARGIGRGGGYIMAPAHGIPGDVPVKNIVALIDFVRNQGKRSR